MYAFMIIRHVFIFCTTLVFKGQERSGCIDSDSEIGGKKNPQMFGFLSANYNHCWQCHRNSAC